METLTMSTILTEVTAIFTACMGMVGDVVTEITDNPLLMLFAVLPLAGIGIGFAKRLINFN